MMAGLFSDTAPAFLLNGFCFVSCGSSPTEASSLLTADIRGGMDKPGLLGLGDEIKGGYFCPFRGDHG